MTIAAYYVNFQVFCECNDNGVPNIKASKGTRRTLENGENELEKSYIKEMDESGFNPNKSCVNSWVMANFKVKKASHSLVESLSKFFSLFLGLHLPREAYRRRTCCMYWLENNIEKVFQACGTNKICCKLTSGQIIDIRPFKRIYTHVKRQTAENVPKEKQKNESESIFDHTDFSIDFNQDDFSNIFY